MEIYIIWVFVRYCKNIRRHYAIHRDKLVADVVKNIGLKLQFSSWFSIHGTFTSIIWILLSNKFNTQYINASFLHQSVSYWEVYPANFFLYLLCTYTSGLKLNFEKEFQSNVFDNVCNKLVIPPRTKFRGIYRNHSVCPSVCADSCQAHNFYMVWHWLTIFGTWVYHHETMCSVHSWSRYDLELWPQGQIYRVFDMFSCSSHNFFLDWHWLNIFGTWMYHHQTMCREHSWSWFNVDLWP